jgi:uncharacterized lipoprotein YddW (UPF0748 family)
MFGPALNNEARITQWLRRIVQRRAVAEAITRYPVCGINFDASLK